MREPRIERNRGRAELLDREIAGVGVRRAGGEQTDAGRRPTGVRVHNRGGDRAGARGQRRVGPLAFLDLEGRQRAVVFDRSGEPVVERARVIHDVSSWVSEVAWRICSNASAISDGRGLPRSADWIAKRNERASSPQAALTAGWWEKRYW